MRNDRAPRPSPKPFADRLGFKLLPILLSLAALIVSVGSLYWKDLSQRPHLAVSVASLELPVTEAPESDPPGQTRGTIRAQLLLSNGGNRGASLVRAGIELRAQPRDGAIACRTPDPASLRFPLTGAALPAVVAPGAIVSVPATSDIVYDWARLHGSRRLLACIVFTSLDHKGASREHRFLLATYVVGKEAEFDRIPEPVKPTASFQLL